MASTRLVFSKKAFQSMTSSKRNARIARSSPMGAGGASVVELMGAAAGADSGAACGTCGWTGTWSSWRTSIRCASTVARSIVGNAHSSAIVSGDTC